MKIKSMIAAVAASAMAVSALAVTAFATPITNANDDKGETYVYAVAENLPEGCNFEDVYGARVVISGVNEETGAGGGIIFNSNSSGWNQVEWGNDGSEKPVIYTYDDFTFTRLEEESPFKNSDEYAQVVIAQWDGWGDAITVESITLLGADGNPLEAKAVEETTTAPEGDENKETTTTTKASGSASGSTSGTKATSSTSNNASAAKTGDAGVGIAVAALSLAGAAAFASRKKH